MKLARSLTFVVANGLGSVVVSAQEIAILEAPHIGSLPSIQDAVA